MITVTSYMNGKEVKSVLPHSGKGLLAMYNEIVRKLRNAGYMQIMISGGAFLTDGEMMYKIEMV